MSLLEKTIYDDFYPLLEDYPLILHRLVEMLQATENLTQVWSSPSMHALYTLAYCTASSDQDAFPLKDPSKFPFPYLWLMRSTCWINGDGEILYTVTYLCDLMSQAITYPTSNYQPEDAILSVEQFLASSRVIGTSDMLYKFKYTWGPWVARRELPRESEISIWKWTTNKAKILIKKP